MLSLKWWFQLNRTEARKERTDYHSKWSVCWKFQQSRPIDGNGLTNKQESTGSIYKINTWCYHHVLQVFGSEITHLAPCTARSFKNIHTYTSTCMLFWDLFFSSISKDVLTHSNSFFACIVGGRILCHLNWRTLKFTMILFWSRHTQLLVLPAGPKNCQKKRHWKQSNLVHGVALNK